MALILDAEKLAFLSASWKLVSGDLSSSIGNGKLRSALGWDEAKFYATKDTLCALGLISRGRGKGGSSFLTSRGEKTLKSSSNSSLPASATPQSAVRLPPDLVDLVAKNLEEDGSLTSEALAANFRIASDEIDSLKAQLETKFPGRVKLRRSGGRLKISFTALSESGSTTPVLVGNNNLEFAWSYEYQSVAVQRLCDLFNREQLREFLAEEYAWVRALVRSHTNRDGKARTLELASALVAIDGMDLLRRHDGTDRIDRGHDAGIPVVLHAEIAIPGTWVEP